MGKVISLILCSPNLNASYKMGTIKLWFGCKLISYVVPSSQTETFNGLIHVLSDIWDEHWGFLQRRLSMFFNLCSVFSPTLKALLLRLPPSRRFTLLLQHGLPHSSTVCCRLRPPLVAAGDTISAHRLHSIWNQTGGCWMAPRLSRTSRKD